ncbi:hypothetical protein OU578_25585 [Escherichia coli]|nr:hypothetical protein [Escherichia coli]
MPNHDRFECQTAIDSDAILHYTELDEHGGWKRKLLSELAYAGVPFDKDKALSA